MRQAEPFFQDDVNDLDDLLLSRGKRVVAMEDVHDGDRGANVIGLRHDCDSGTSLATAVKMARWEQEHGYRSSYYLLHTSSYWESAFFADMVYEIAASGHEIGIHTNALAESFRTGEDPDLILERAIKRLRDLGHPIRGVAGHGDRFCSRGAMPGEPWFANDEQFIECRRKKIAGVPVGEPDRLIWRGSVKRRIQPRPLADFGLEYEALHLSVPFYFRLSDSGGKWCDEGFYAVVERFAKQTTIDAVATKVDDPYQLHILQHPDWWAEAFPLRVAA